MSESEIMYDDSEMTPQEQEKAVRDRVTELKNEIMETVAHLSYLYHEYVASKPLCHAMSQTLNRCC